MDSPSEFDWEPVPGLPAPLPDNEHIVWQGAPRWLTLAIDAFHVRKVALYFGALILWNISEQLRAGADTKALLAGPALTLILCLCAIGILLSLAWLSASATIYTLTNKRLLIRFGIAIQLTINLPFKQILAADVAVGRRGHGNIPLRLAKGSRVSYLVLWPHVRPWHFRQPQPMLRAVPEAAHVAKLMATTIGAQAQMRSLEVPASDSQPPLSPVASR